MLLRKLMEHVRTQNWFAVWIDFAIVVVGVFIGIQVANWNENEAERAQTERLLTALTGDLASMRAQLVSQREHYSEVAVELDLLLTKLLQGDLGTEYAAQVMNKGMSFRVPPAAPARLSELLIAGRTDLVERSAVDEAVRVLAKDLSVHSKASDTLRQQFVESQRALLPHVQISRSPRNEGGAGYFAIESVEVDTIRASDELASELVRIYMIAANMQEIIQASIDAINSALAAIDRR